jgi:hypothetical protein
MLRLRRGRIVFISSVVGLLGSPGQVNYAASKAGLVGMARSMARELGSRGITTNVVAPGFVETDMTEVLPEATRKQYLGQIPLGRFGGTEEIAKVVRWISSEEAGYITGAVIPVDGGLGMATERQPLTTAHCAPVSGQQAPTSRHRPAAPEQHPDHGGGPGHQTPGPQHRTAASSPRPQKALPWASSTASAS